MNQHSTCSLTGFRLRAALGVSASPAGFCLRMSGVLHLSNDTSSITRYCISEEATTKVLESVLTAAEILFYSALVSETSPTLHPIPPHPPLPPSPPSSSSPPSPPWSPPGIPPPPRGRAGSGFPPDWGPDWGWRGNCEPALDCGGIDFHVEDVKHKYEHKYLTDVCLSSSLWISDMLTTFTGSTHTGLISLISQDDT